MPSSDTAAQISSLYLAYFGRPADPAGLAFWINVVENANVPLPMIVNVFANSSEAQERFKGLSPEQLVNNIYETLFNRQAEPAGLKHWADAIKSQQISVGQAVAAILQGAQDGETKDSSLVALRNEVCLRFTQSVGDPRKYSGSAAADAITLLSAAITLDTTPQQIDALLQAARQLAQWASEQPETYSALMGLGNNALELLRLGGGANSLDVMNLLSNIINAAVKEAGPGGNPASQVNKLLGKYGSLEDVLKNLPSGTGIKDVSDAVAGSGLVSGGVEAGSRDPIVEPPPPPPPPPDPPSATFTVGLNLGALVFGGTATGDITFSVAPDGTATFTRAGVTAFAKPNVANFTTAGGQTIKLSANVVDVSAETAAKLLNVTGFNANGKTYSISDFVTGILGQMMLDSSNSTTVISGAAAVKAKDLVPVDLNVAQAVALNTAGVDIPNCYNLTDTADNLAPGGSALTAVIIAIEVTVTGTATAVQLISIGDMIFNANQVKATDVTTISGSGAEFVNLLALANTVPTKKILLSTDFSAVVTGTAATADQLNAIDAATTTVVDATSVTSITGAATQLAAVAFALGNGRLQLATDFAATVSDATSVSYVNTIEAANGTGVVTATITDNDVDTLKTLTGTGNAYTIEISANGVDAADLVAIDDKTTVAVVSTNVGKITGTSVEVAALVANKNLGTITLASNFETALTSDHTLAQLAAINNATSGTITLSNYAIDLSGAAADVAAALDGITTYTGNVTLTTAATVGQWDLMDIATTGAISGTISDTILAANGKNFTTGYLGNTGITLTGSGGSQTVTGSGMADSLAGGAGADNLTGGVGIDTFVFAVGDSTLADMDTITDYRAAGEQDVLNLKGITVSPSSSATVVDANGFASVLRDALNAMALDNDVANGVSVFIFAGDTYVYVESTSGAGLPTYTDGDTVIKILGTPWAVGQTVDLAPFGIGSSL